MDEDAGPPDVETAAERQLSGCVDQQRREIDRLQRELAEVRAGYKTLLDELADADERAAANGARVARQAALLADASKLLAEGVALLDDRRERDAARSGRVAELEALTRSQAERIAGQSELLSRTAELRAALAPVVEWVRWGEQWPGGRQPDAAVIAIGCRIDPAYVLTVGHLRRLAALAGGPAVELPPPPPDSPPPAAAGEGPVMGAEGLS